MEANQPDSPETFDQRMSEWIASQGFWFQLRYSMSGGGGWSVAFFHLLRMAFRLLILAVLVGLGLLYYLTKRVDTLEFREGMEARFAESTGASEVKILNFKRTQGVGMIRRLGAEGTTTSFFDSLEAGNLRFKMGLLDGLRSDWKPGVIEVNWIDAVVKGGANSPEEAGQSVEVLFRDIAGFQVDGIEVTNARISWGFHVRDEIRNFGEISGSKLEATRIGSSWRLIFRGGTFSQNWIRGFRIEEMVLILRPDGLEVEKGLLRAGDGTVEFTDVRVDGGEFPEFSGKLVIDSVPVSSLVANQLESRIDGQLTGELDVSGSTNSPEGLKFAGTLRIDEGDKLTIRDEFQLLRTLDVVDAFNNYKRIDFDEGSFEIETGGGQMEISRVDLAAGESMTLRGRVVVRRPSREEAARIMGLDPDFELGPVTGRGDAGAQGKAELSLQRAAAEARRAEEGEDVVESLEFFAGIQKDRSDAERIRREASDRFLRTLIFDGGFRMTIPGDAFDRSRVLRERYPVEPETGRIGIDVPLEGPLFTLTEGQAEMIYRLDSESR